MSNKRIAANVVTYNRKQLLGECIDALLNQTYPLDAIYIIDNASTDGTPEFLKEKGLIDDPLFPDKEPVEAVKIISSPLHSEKIVEIHYVRIPENTGSSGGQHEGVRRGYDAGFDWLWLMDDDAEPKDNALELLVTSPYFSKDETGALLCSIRNKSNKCEAEQTYTEISTESVVRCERVFRGKTITISDFDQPFLKVSTYPLLGIFVRREAITKVGNVNKEFFIFSDDLDFTLRISDSYEMWIVRNSIIKHKAAAALFTPRMVLGRQIHFIPIQNHWREYYGYRNYIYIALQRLGLARTLLVLAGYTKVIGKYLLLGDHKFLRMSIYIKALKDALFGTLGKNIDPKQFSKLIAK
ncbi:MAG: glycosyltransferase family 2 protein [Nitrospirae bacterium]|nr:glycosyltransferase family 2 protein [Nitrospirota bacterium]